MSTSVLLSSAHVRKWCTLGDGPFASVDRHLFRQLCRHGEKASCSPEEQDSVRNIPSRLRLIVPLRAFRSRMSYHRGDNGGRSSYKIA